MQSWPIRIENQTGFLTGSLCKFWRKKSLQHFQLGQAASLNVKGVPKIARSWIMRSIPDTVSLKLQMEKFAKLHFFFVKLQSNFDHLWASWVNCHLLWGTIEEFERMACPCKPPNFVWWKKETTFWAIWGLQLCMATFSSSTPLCSGDSEKCSDFKNYHLSLNVLASVIHE